MKLWFAYASSHSADYTIHATFHSFAAVEDAFLLVELLSLLYDRGVSPGEAASAFAERGLDRLAQQVAVNLREIDTYGDGHPLLPKLLGNGVAPPILEITLHTDDWHVPAERVLAPLSELLLRLGASQVEPFDRGA